MGGLFGGAGVGDPRFEVGDVSALGREFAVDARRGFGPVAVFFAEARGAVGKAAAGGGEL